MTGKIVVYIAMSLDGHIADSSGRVDWLSGDGSDPENEGTYQAFYEKVESVVLGYETYRQIREELSPDSWPYDDIPSYIITHRTDLTDDEVIFINQDLPTFIKQLREKSQGTIWIGGGANIIQQVLAADLVDQLTVTIIPTILGKGIPLFLAQKEEIRLKLIKTETYNGMTDLVYERRLASPGSDTNANADQPAASPEG